MECSYSDFHWTQIIKYAQVNYLILEKWFLLLVFEPDEDDKNESEYKKIHEDYKNLVRVSVLCTYPALINN